MKHRYISDLNPREVDILAHADHFVAVRGRGSNRTRTVFPTLEDAVFYGETFKDGKTMCYAVAGDNTPCVGGVAHILNA